MPNHSPSISGNAAVEESCSISLSDVSFSYNGVKVLQNVDLSICNRDLTYIVGPNGGGKTTLLKLMLGLLKPDSGEIQVLGRSPQMSRHLVGYSPQHIHFDPHFPITVRDVILSGRLRKGSLGFYTRDDKVAANRIMNEFDLSQVSGKQFSELSGGQRQRVLISRALVNDPEILLLDEPTSNVDSEAEAMLLNIIKKLKTEMTIILVSHDLGFVSEMVKSVVCVNRKVLVHPTSEVTEDVIRNIYDEGIRLIRHDLDAAGSEHSHG